MSLLECRCVVAFYSADTLMSALYKCTKAARYAPAGGRAAAKWARVDEACAWVISGADDRRLCLRMRCACCWTKRGPREAAAAKQRIHSGSAEAAASRERASLGAAAAAAPCRCELKRRQSSRRPAGTESRARLKGGRWQKHLHHHLFQSLLLLAFDDNTGTCERLLQASDDFILQSEESYAIIAKHIQLFGNISQPGRMQHIGVLKVEFRCLGGEKQIKIGHRPRQQLLRDVSGGDASRTRVIERLGE
jgi:hypothetical protein